jgi:hypothetical protein
MPREVMASVALRADAGTPVETADLRITASVATRWAFVRR